MNKITEAHKTIFVIAFATALCYLKFSSVILIYLALGLLIFGTVFKLFRELVHKLWMKLAFILSRITQPIILGALFFIVLTPLALLKRVFSKENKAPKESTFVSLKKQFNQSNFKNPW